jgi:hypothetical protein
MAGTTTILPCWSSQRTGFVAGSDTPELSPVGSCAGAWLDRRLGPSSPVLLASFGDILPVHLNLLQGFLSSASGGCGSFWPK